MIKDENNKITLKAKSENIFIPTFGFEKSLFFSRN
jgi:hypothetical protein